MYPDPVGFPQTVRITGPVGPIAAGSTQTLLVRLSPTVVAGGYDVYGTFRLEPFDSADPAGTDDILFDTTLSTPDLAANIETALNAAGCIAPGFVTVTGAASANRAFFEFTITFYFVPDSDATRHPLAVVDAAYSDDAMTVTVGFTASKSFTVTLVQSGEPDGDVVVTIDGVASADIAYVSTSLDDLSSSYATALNDAFGSLPTTSPDYDAVFTATAYSAGGYNDMDVLVVVVTSSGVASLLDGTLPTIGAGDTSPRQYTYAIGGPFAHFVYYAGDASAGYSTSYTVFCNGGSATATWFDASEDTAAGLSTAVNTAAPGAVTAWYGTPTTSSADSCTLGCVAVLVYADFGGYRAASGLSVGLTDYIQGIVVGDVLYGGGELPRMRPYSQTSDTARLFANTLTTAIQPSDCTGYDVVYDVACVAGYANCAVSRLTVNGDVVGLIDTSWQFFRPVAGLLVAGVLSTSTPLLHAFPVTARVKALVVGVWRPELQPDEFIFGLPKAPWVYTNLLDSLRCGAVPCGIVPCCTVYDSAKLTPSAPLPRSVPAYAVLDAAKLSRLCGVGRC